MKSQSSPLPFQPEALPVARSRYWEAVWPLYSVDRIRQQTLEAPGGQRKHVFDFKTGIRMIITREHSPLNENPEDRGPFLHIGAKIMEGHEQMNGKQVPIGEIVRNFLYMSRSPKDIEPIWSHISENGVLHILFEPPFKGEYAEDVPLEVVQQHEKHKITEENTIPGPLFDPRKHCSLCSKKSA